MTSFSIREGMFLLAKIPSGSHSGIFSFCEGHYNVKLFKVHLVCFSVQHVVGSLRVLLEKVV